MTWRHRSPTAIRFGAGRRHLPVARPRLRRQQRRRHRRLPRPDRRSSTTSPALGVSCLWLLPFYPSPLRDDGYDIADYEDVHPDYGTVGGLPRASFRGAHDARPARHHRARHQPHVGPAPVVPGGAARAGRIGQSATSTSGATRTRRYQGVAHHLLGYGDVELVVGPRGRRLLLAPLLPPSAGPELRQPARARGGAVRSCASGSTGASTACASTRVPIPHRARRHGLRRASPETHEVLRELRRELDAALHGSDAARGGQPVAGRRAARISASGDECHMAFNFPLMPRMLHGACARRIATRSPRSSGQTPDIPATLPVGASSCATTTS